MKFASVQSRHYLCKGIHNMQFISDMKSTLYKTVILFAFLTFSFLSTAVSQTAAIEKLEGALKSHTRTDTTRVNLLIKLGYEVSTFDTKRAKEYAEEAQKIATQLNYPKGKAGSLWITGLTIKDTPKEALKYYEEALRIAEEINDQSGICYYLLAISEVQGRLGNTEAMNEAIEKGLSIAATLKDPIPHIKLLYNSANSLSKKGDYPQALAKYQQVFLLATQSDDKTMMAKASSSIATTFYWQGNLSQALEYYLSSLRIYEEQNAPKGICQTLINMGNIKVEQHEHEAGLKDLNRALEQAKEIDDKYLISACYTNIGNTYERMKRHPEALRYLHEALRMENGGNIGLKTNLLINISCVYIAQEKYDEALKDLNQALDLAVKANIKFAHSEILRLLSAIYYNKKQYARAIDYADQAMLIANKFDYLELQKNIHELLSVIYSDSGNFKKAYHSQKMFKQLNDSIFNEKNVRKMALMESAYKYDKEIQQYELENRNHQLQIKNQFYAIVSLVAVTLLISILSFQLYRSNRLKKKVLKLEIDQANSKLEYSNKEMTSATLKLIQNSESDSYCIKMLESIAKTSNEERENNIRSLIGYYKNKSACTNWEEFETLFLAVNADFYDKLNKRVSTLTPNERKLCVFLKLNMNNKDIAQITFQSEDALKKARLRLRKKLELTRNENLTSFIQNL